MYIHKVLFFLAVVPASFAAQAEQAEQAELANTLDEKGRLILQVNKDNSRIINAYDKDGRLVKKETSPDQRFSFDSRGNSVQNDGGQKP